MRKKFRKRSRRKFTFLGPRSRIPSGRVLSISRRWGALRRSEHYFRHKV